MLCVFYHNKKKVCLRFDENGSCFYLKITKFQALFSVNYSHKQLQSWQQPSTLANNNH